MQRRRARCVCVLENCVEEGIENGSDGTETDAHENHEIVEEMQLIGLETEASVEKTASSVWPQGRPTFRTRQHSPHLIVLWPQPSYLKNCDVKKWQLQVGGRTWPT